MSNVHYTTSQTDNTYRVELANYFEGYPKIMFNSEWSYFIGLTYKTNNTSDKKSCQKGTRTHIGRNERLDN